MLTRVTKGVRNQAQEMINNLPTIENALRHSMDPSIPINMAHFFASGLVSRRRIKSNKHVQAHHKSTKEDPSIRALFPHFHIEFHQTLTIGHLRLCTKLYSHAKVADDSNIVFRLGGNETFGRIRSIVSVDGEEPFLVVTHLRNVLPLVCPVDDIEDYTYAHIQISADQCWSFVLVEVRDFVERAFSMRVLMGCVCVFDSLI
jgi:hypothetical protein